MTNLQVRLSRASLGMFSKPARQHALPRISNETELVNYMGRKQAAETAETHYITAESQVPTLPCRFRYKSLQFILETGRRPIRRELG